MLGYRDGIIIENHEISPNIFKVILQGDFQGLPGQFYMLRGWNGLDPFLARPISIANLEEGKITFLYEVRGKGTHIISQLKAGNKLSLLGPLGNGFDYKTDKKVALVAGAIGLAPFYYLARLLGQKPDLYAGFRDRSYFMEEFEEYTDQIYISTEDGSEGHKEYIIDILNPEDYDLIIACGPTAMMQVLADKNNGMVPLYMSMESHMACGIGSCMGCTIETKAGRKRVCKDGPVFSAEEVIFND